MRIITYQLAYATHRRVGLCDRCAERGDHGAGVLGPVSHGKHEGMCEGARHVRVVTIGVAHGCEGLVMDQRNPNRPREVARTRLLPFGMRARAYEAAEALISTLPPVT